MMMMLFGQQDAPNKEELIGLAVGESVATFSVLFFYVPHWGGTATTGKAGVTRNAIGPSTLFWTHYDLKGNLNF